MYKHDTDESHVNSDEALVIELAEEAGHMTCASTSFVYKSYNE